MSSVNPRDLPFRVMLVYGVYGYYYYYTPGSEDNTGSLVTDR